MSNTIEQVGLPTPAEGISRRLKLLLAITVGLVVGNMYYMQPLLVIIAHALHLSEGQVGGAATLAMVGQALGMLLVCRWTISTITARELLVRRQGLRLQRSVIQIRKPHENSSCYCFFG